MRLETVRCADRQNHRRLLLRAVGAASNAVDGLALCALASRDRHAVRAVTRSPMTYPFAYPQAPNGSLLSCRPRQHSTPPRLIPKCASLAGIAPLLGCLLVRAFSRGGSKPSARALPIGIRVLGRSRTLAARMTARKPRAADVS